MIDNIIKDATCSVSCGNEFGTGYLIADYKILTARHCVIEAIESDCSITLTFVNSETIPAKLLAHSEEMDACILSISQPVERQPIPIDAEIPREGSTWRSFGYPNGKTIIGHRITGLISHLLDTPKLKMDIDLTVDPMTSLQDYQGLSGAAVINEGMSRGMVRLKVDGTLGAISLHRLAGFLAENGIQIPPPATNESVYPEPDNDLADRSEFQETFEQIIIHNPGDYVFLQGAHGIGKTTFCNEFAPNDRSLFTLGTYSLVTQDRGPGAIYRVQPEVFFDWLSTAVSTLVTGKNSRKEERSYPQLVNETSKLLEAFSNYCVSTDRHGILFLDGLNEGQAVDPSALMKLIGLLPQSLPKTVTIVLTAPNHHSVNSSITGRVKNENIISLPPLSDMAVSFYCRQKLAKDKATPALIAQICEKAQGHPLYLRYLIEYANNTSEINEFPTLTGTIEQYYELIWQKLLEDTDAINLLAIIARLRWGIEKDDILKVLTSPEQAAFIPTISRIQHLLLNPATTTIYHPSFTEFIISKTSDLELVIQKRLAEFCVEEPQLEYCALNVVFHLLRSDDVDRSQAVVTCKQKWVDTCVSLGIEPDTLLFDIEATLAVAVNFGQTVEAIRLLLLSQRINFRYNTLFAQSARLIAEALIVLKRPREALKHAVRFKTLIVAPDEALQIAFCFIQHEYQEEALELLDLLHQKILEVYTSSSNGFNLQEFIYICKLYLRTLFFMRLTDGQGRMNQILGFLEHVRHVFNTTLTEESPELLHESYVRVSCVFMCYFLCFRDTYPTLDERKEKMGEPAPLSFLLDIIFALFEYEESIEKCNLPNEIASLPQVFSDIEELLKTGANLDRQLVPDVIDTLIQLGAPSSLVHLIANKGEKITPHPLKIKADNGVDVDFLSIQQGAAEWRITAFLNNDFACPLVGAFDETGWLSSLDQLICALYWCEGKARRAKVDGNESLLLQTQELFKTRVLLPLAFTLAQRVKWQDSYAIPENMFPLLYERITLVLIDCYPKYLSEFLQVLSERANDQCGLYTEGFREVMFAVLQKMTIREIEPSLFDKVFSLLQQWKDHVLSGVENRHELVPELLRMIPLFVKVGACEESEKLYQYMLSVSMGPS
ncbi:MAG: serine protease [Candidatus Electrothrix sp. AX1]|nr:serine protease [Candidatus Electrothrix sp. AX1]